MDVLAQAQGVGSSGFPWAEFGLAGAVIGALFLFIWKVLADHKEERKQWRESIEKISTSHDGTTKEMSDKFIALHEKMFDGLSKDKRNG